jgi:DNA-binding transcriptional regulator YdaS (Cro superfamily)
MKYKSEGWFVLLQNAAKAISRKAVADALGASPAQVSQVLNGTGKYGSGQCSTDRIAEKVLHTFGQFACPHLSEQANGQAIVITAEQCRGYAHRPAPTGSPRDMQHWQACNSCPHKAHTAPPKPREVKPRKPRSTNQEGT